jgi:hypothetical protein
MRSITRSPRAGPSAPPISAQVVQHVDLVEIAATSKADLTIPILHWDTPAP